MKRWDGITSEGVHYWKGCHENQYFVSVEESKTLRSFRTVDDVVNWLYMNELKDSAREVNKFKSEAA